MVNLSNRAIIDKFAIKNENTDFLIFFITDIV